MQPSLLQAVLTYPSFWVKLNFYYSKFISQIGSKLKNMLAEKIHLLGRHKKIWIATLCVLMGLAMARSTVPSAMAEQTKEEKAWQKMLNLEAANALWRLKRALKKDAFYSGRARLNVWRAAAMDAGKFDPQKYEEFKNQLYENSVNDSLKCFEYFIEQNGYHDANMCLQTWKIHAKEIDMFDESTYQEYIQRLNSLKEKKSE